MSKSEFEENFLLIKLFDFVKVFDGVNSVVESSFSSFVVVELDSLRVLDDLANTLVMVPNEDIIDFD